MSRCFPFPSPGYKLGRAAAADVDVALIESIKLQREREQAKAERKKEKKKEKKEKRKEKKHKAYLNSSHLSHDQKIDNVEMGQAVLKYGFVECGREEETVQSEKSTVTEEHGHHFSSQKPSSSFDSTQHSNKRKRLNSPPAIVKQEGYVSHEGNVIRIQLPKQKQRVVDAVVVREAPCSTYGRTDLPVQPKNNFGPVVVQDEILTNSWETNNGLLPCRPNAEQICSTLVKTEAVIEENASFSGCNKQKLRRRDSKYKHLMENCIPPFPMELDFDDEDWLLPRKKPKKQVENKLKATQEISSCGRSALWPRAQLFPEADIYALPFTVPF